MNSEIDKAVSGVGQLSTSGLNSLNQLQSALTASQPKAQSPYETASLPCFIYPTSKTFRFFDRAEDIVQIDRFFNNGTPGVSQPFRSLTLHGIGGVGKSAVALRYAETRIHCKKLDAMFWIASEKEVTIRQSFTDIAMRLKLPGAEIKDHDQNRTLVLDWLQKTGKIAHL